MKILIVLLAALGALAFIRRRTLQSDRERVVAAGRNAGEQAVAAGKEAATKVTERAKGVTDDIDLTDVEAAADDLGDAVEDTVDHATSSLN